eukprot:gb/GECG01004570.1/.p1 GENE.gb/GECG01004570.1/~~gb/GECG01004570.1/.p1  ORF type:complete len:2508 (+),score=242.23 gb/GECG01004570.1/:1-7524(+)
MDEIDATSLLRSVNKIVEEPDDTNNAREFRARFEQHFSQLQNPRWYPGKTEESKRKMEGYITQAHEHYFKEMAVFVADQLNLDHVVALALLTEDLTNPSPSRCFYENTKGPEERAIALFFYHRRQLLLALSGILSNRGEDSSSQEAFIHCVNRLILQTRENQEESADNVLSMNLMAFLRSRMQEVYEDMNYLTELEQQYGRALRKAGGRGFEGLSKEDRARYLTCVFRCTDLQLVAQCLFSLYEKTPVQSERELNQLVECIRDCSNKIWATENHDEGNPLFDPLVSLIFALMSGLEYREGKYIPSLRTVEFARFSPSFAIERGLSRGANERDRGWSPSEDGWSMQGAQGVVFLITALFYYGVLRPDTKQLLQDTGIEEFGLHHHCVMDCDVEVKGTAETFYKQLDNRRLIGHVKKKIQVLFDKAYQLGALKFISRIVCSKGFVTSADCTKWIETLHDGLVECIHFETFLLHRSSPLLFRTQQEHADSFLRRSRGQVAGLNSHRDCLEELITLQIQLLRLRPRLAAQYLCVTGPLTANYQQNMTDMEDASHSNGFILCEQTEYLKYICDKYDAMQGPAYILMARILDLFSCLAHGGFAADGIHSARYVYSYVMSSSSPEGNMQHIYNVSRCPEVLSLPNLVQILQHIGESIDYDIQKRAAIERKDSLERRGAPPSKISEAKELITAILNKERKALKTLEGEEASLVESILGLLQSFAQHTWLCSTMASQENAFSGKLVIRVLFGLLIQNISVSLKGELLYTLSLFAREKTYAEAIWKELLTRNLVPLLNQRGRRKMKLLGDITLVEPQEHNYAISVGFVSLLRSLLHGKTYFEHLEPSLVEDSRLAAQSYIQVVVDEILLKAFRKPRSDGQLGRVAPWKIAACSLSLIHDLLRSYQPETKQPTSASGFTDPEESRPFAFSRKNTAYELMYRLLSGGDLFEFLFFLLSYGNGAAGLEERRLEQLRPQWEQRLRDSFNRFTDGRAFSGVDYTELELDAFDAALTTAAGTAESGRSVPAKWSSAEAQAEVRALAKLDHFFRGGSSLTGDGRWPTLAQEEDSGAFSDDECWWRERCVLLSLSIMESLSFKDTVFVASVRGMDINDNDLSQGVPPRHTSTLIERIRGIPTIMRYMAYPHFFDSRVSYIATRLVHRMVTGETATISLENVWSQLESHDLEPLCMKRLGNMDSIEHVDHGVYGPLSQGSIISGIASLIQSEDHTHGMQDVLLAGLSERMRLAASQSKGRLTVEGAAGTDTSLDAIMGQQDFFLDDEDSDEVWLNGVDTGSGRKGKIPLCGEVDFGIGVDMLSCIERTGHTFFGLRGAQFLLDLLQSSGKYARIGPSSAGENVPEVSITLAARQARLTVLSFLCTFVEVCVSPSVNNPCPPLAKFLLGFSSEHRHMSCLQKIIKLLDMPALYFSRPQVTEAAVSIILNLAKWKETSAAMLSMLRRHLRILERDEVHGRFFFLRLLNRLSFPFETPMDTALSQWDCVELSERVEKEHHEESDISARAERVAAFQNTIAAVLNGCALELKLAQGDNGMQEKIFEDALNAVTAKGEHRFYLQVLLNLLELGSFQYQSPTNPSEEGSNVLTRYAALLADHPHIGYRVNNRDDSYVYDLNIVRNLLEREPGSGSNTVKWVRELNDFTVACNSSEELLKGWLRSVCCLFSGFMNSAEIMKLSRRKKVQPARDLMFHILTILQERHFSSSQLLERFAEAILFLSKYVREVSLRSEGGTFLQSSPQKSLVLPPFSEEDCHSFVASLVREVCRKAKLNSGPTDKTIVDGPSGEPNKVQHHRTSAKYRAKLYLSLMNILRLCLGHASWDISAQEQQTPRGTHLEGANDGEEFIFPFSNNLTDCVNDVLFHEHRGVGLDLSINVDTVTHPIYGNLDETLDGSVTELLESISGYRQTVLTALDRNQEGLLHQLVQDVSHSDFFWRVPAAHLLSMILHSERNVERTTALQIIGQAGTMKTLLESLSHLDLFENREVSDEGDERSSNAVAVTEAINSLLDVILLCSQSVTSCSVLLCANLLATIDQLLCLDEASQEASGIVDELVPARSSALIAEKLFPRISRILSIIINVMYMRPYDNQLTEQVNVFVLNHKGLLTTFLHLATLLQTSVFSVKLGTLVVELLSLLLSRDTSKVDSTCLVDESGFRPYMLALIRKYVSQPKSASFAYDDPFGNLHGAGENPRADLDSYGPLSTSSAPQQNTELALQTRTGTALSKMRYYVYQSGGIGLWSSEVTNVLAQEYGETWWYSLKPMTYSEEVLSRRMLRFVTHGGIVQTQYANVIVTCVEKLFARLLWYIRVVSSERGSHKSAVGLSTTLHEPVFLRKQPKQSEDTTPHGSVSLEVLARSVQQLGIALNRMASTRAQLDVVAEVMNGTNSLSNIRQRLSGRKGSYQGRSHASVSIVVSFQLDGGLANEDPADELSGMRHSLARAQLRALSSFGNIKFALENAIWMWYMHAQFSTALRPSVEYIEEMERTSMPGIADSSPFSAKMLRFLKRLSME